MAEGNVFVSYRRDDASGYARVLHEKLCDAFGADGVFMDVEAIEPGVDFVLVIKERLAASRVLLALIGKGWLQRDAAGARRIDDPKDFVRLEVGSALAGKLAVIPVLLGGAALPRPDELPDDLRALTRRNALEIRDTRFDADVENLIAVIRKHFETDLDDDGGRAGLRGVAAQAAGVCAALAFVFFGAWTSFLNVFGVDDAVEGFLLGRFEPFALRPTGRRVFLIAASEKPGQNGPLTEPLGDAWRRHHARLVEILARACARVVAFDLTFDGPSDANAELAAALRAAEAQGTGVVLAMPQVDERGQPTTPPSPEFAGLPWGIAEASHSRRRMRLAAPVKSPAWARTTQVVPSLALQAVAQYRQRELGLTDVRPHAAARLDWLELRAGDRVIEQFPVVDVQLDMIVEPPVGPAFLEPLPYHQIHGSARDAPGLARFKDAIVLVGFETEDDLRQVAGRAEKRYGMQFHGMAIAQLLEHRWLRRPTLGEQLAGFVLLGAVGLGLRHPALQRRRVRLALPKPLDRVVHVPVAPLLALLLYFLAAFALYRWGRIVVVASYDVAALLLTYAVAGWIRRRRFSQPPAAA